MGLFDRGYNERMAQYEQKIKEQEAELKQLEQRYREMTWRKVQKAGTNYSKDEFDDLFNDVTKGLF